MATSKGVIQGDCGVAAVDAKQQIIVDAQAHGTGSEQGLLISVVKRIAPHLHDYSLITADAGYYSENNLRQLAEMQYSAGHAMAAPHPSPLPQRVGGEGARPDNRRTRYFRASSSAANTIASTAISAQRRGSNACVAKIRLTGGA